MIEVFRKDGHIEAVIEWHSLDGTTIEVDAEDVYVMQIEISDNVNGVSVIKQFIRTIMEKNKNAKRCTFVRDFKYPNRKKRVYTREQFSKYLGGNNGK